MSQQSQNTVAQGIYRHYKAVFINIAYGAAFRNRRIASGISLPIR